MPRQPQDQLSPPTAFLEAVRAPGLSLRDRFKGNPVLLAESLGLKLPRKPLVVMRELGIYDEEKHGPITPGLRDLVMEVCNLLIKSAVVVGPRGGGKSQGVSFIEFYLVFVLMFDALNLGGSELQADQVYQYLVSYIDSDPYWQSLVKGEALASKTTTVDNSWIRVLTASQRSVRSPHAGGRKPGGRFAGGILVIDEEAEAPDGIVAAALPTINTARPSVNVRSSTFHNEAGSFAELVDDHEEMGYKMFRWNVFDVSERCTDSCDECEPCFAKDHYEDYADPDTGEVHSRLVHKAYCGGVAHYSEGWVPISETKALWRRIKRNHAVFEVEQMGSRPSSSGYVIRNRMNFKQCQVDTPATSIPVEGCWIEIDVDWGSSNAGLTVWQELPGDRHLLRHAHLLEEYGESQIIGMIMMYVGMYRGQLREVAADIGGGGSYLNPKLREEYRLPLRDVNFQTEKELAASAWNVYNDALKVIIPTEHNDFIKQVDKWRRVNGRIQKGNDHLCDSSLCYWAKFAGRLQLRKRPPVGPRSVSTAPSQPAGGRSVERAHVPIRRSPVGIRTIGGR